MSVVPDMLRVEMFHPVVVHFPIVLLLCGTIARLIGEFVASDGVLGFLKPAGRAALLVGAALAWLAVFTGDLADGEVSRMLCDPRVKQSHEDLAYVVGYIFSAAILVDLGAAYFKAQGRLRVGLTVAVLLACIGGSGLMGYVGHLGGQLVYQQAAGVYHPTPECTEFTDTY
ncbi:DUF2231 domain-containing protein [Bradymonas sediminis]|uniref:Uncharacterized protein n=1 Tax=Bradymonas sediminis TaxID=1548548 RepID=A0A2Z4FH45_9DELT|nr:DUF2231 domain-containing protein [Bradymonas sediminis]AWV88331.1 hypothetical protein DN745_02825 [Bradymonas sediminis]TDP77456.1 putative membrane protein [Bradymonas sediminis]